MQREEQNIKPKRPQNLILEGRKKLSISGVIDIDSFNEQGVIALTELGVMIIKGEDLHINKLNVESGDVTIEAKSIDSITYTDISDKKTGSILKSLFK